MRSIVLRAGLRTGLRAGLRTGLRAGLVAAVAAVPASPVRAQVLSEGVLTGEVVDADTGDVLAGVVVTASGRRGAVIAVTDDAGRYRLDGLLPDTYAVTFAKDGFVFDAVADVRVRAAATLRLDGVGSKGAPPSSTSPSSTTPTTPEGAPATGKQPEQTGKTIKVTAGRPVVDVGSTQSGGVLDSDVIKRVPLVAPSAKGGAQRGFEAAATVLPQVKTDTYGASINGATSVENQYAIDGLTVNNGGFGTNGSPLSVEFVDELGVITGGYLPEYGRAMGGLMNVVTKSGGNTVQGSVFSSWTPGFLEGARLRPPAEGTVIQTTQELDNVGDVGFTLGGPIIKDKLFFFAGGDLSTIRYVLHRKLVATDGTVIPGGSDDVFASQSSLQGIAKLTWAINEAHRLSFTLLATPSQGGGKGELSIDPATGEPEVTSLEGSVDALAHLRRAGALDGTLKWEATLPGLDGTARRLRLDTSIGLHHEIQQVLPSDGTAIGSGQGLSAVPRVEFRRSNPGSYSIRKFEDVGAGFCENGSVDNATLCPVQTYQFGGPAFLRDATYDRVQGRHVAQYTLEAGGLHILKAGVDASYTNYHLLQAYSGGDAYRDTSDGSFFFDDGLFGTLTGPDAAHPIDKYDVNVGMLNVGAFAQDTWTPFDALTVNAGVRWDGEWQFSGDGQLSIAMPHEWSPRLGVIVDPTSSGKMKLWGSFARYYQSIPLDIAQRSGTGDPTILSYAPASVCDPTTPAGRKACDDDDNKIVINGPDQPDQKWYVIGAGRTAVDPNLQPPSSDEVTVGAEGEVFRNARVGAVYTRRWIGCPFDGAKDVAGGLLCSKSIEDMSRDEANTYFVGNPGFGIANDFPEATRTYDALTLMFSKQFADEWLAQVSYTLSWLRGNYAGLFRPETGQLDPFINSDFDLRSLTVNRTGDLPFDSRHQIKAFGAREFQGTHDTTFTLGGAVEAAEGGPTNLLGSHPVYGGNEVFVLPRGSGQRLDWNWSADVHGGFTFRPVKGQEVELTLDVFNLFDLHAVTAVDETYTTADVDPLVGCKAGDKDSCTRDDLDKVKQIDGTPLEDGQVNPNLGNPTAYQTPRQVRLGLRWSF